MSVTRRSTQILVGLLRFEMVLSVVSAFLFLLYPLVSSGIRSYLSTLVLGIQGAWVVSTLAILIFWPIWSYASQRDLAVRFDGYPIKPWRTVLWFLVPWYSVVGALTLAKTLTDHLLAEEDNSFQPQPYHAIDPRYQSWVVLNLLPQGGKSTGYGTRLLRAFLILHGIWFCTFFLAFLGFGHELNFFAPTMILFFHNALLDLPVFGWMPGFPSTEDTLLKTAFVILTLWVLTRIVTLTRKVIENE